MLDEMDDTRGRGWHSLVPPDHVKDRTPTVEDVQLYPEWFICGPGQQKAHNTLCRHGYRLTDSCPCCP